VRNARSAKSVTNRSRATTFFAGARSAAECTDRSDRKRHNAGRRTTQARHRELGAAVVDLRLRMRWGQEDLAEQVKREALRARMKLEPSQGTISRWEQRQQSPSPTYSMVLARLATRHGHDDLAERFRARVARQSIGRAE